ncbi:MAG: cytochrome c biogenesis protein CcdA [Acidimicrobiia bacterium]
MTTTDRQLVRRARARYLIIALGLMIVGFFGYLGFRVIATGGVSAGSVGLGAATGFAAFFSPCSFPLLLTFLTKRSGESAPESVASAARVAIGVAVLLAIIATGVVFLGEAVAKVVAFDQPAGRTFRALVGVVLVVFGLHQAHLMRTRFRMFDKVASVAAAAFEPRSKRRWVSDVTYGFGYLLAGFGCTGALLAGLATQSVTVGTATTLWSFAAAIGVFTLLIASASIGVSVAAGDSLQALRMVGSTVRKWSGYVLIALGAWFFFLAALPSPLL